MIFPLTEKNLKNKNLLIISHSYSSFIKDQVDLISNYFKNVYVLLRYNPFAEISKFLPINAAKPFEKKRKIDLTGKPENVYVYTVSMCYLPTERSYRKLAKQHLKKVLKIIEKNKITFDIVHAHFLWSAGYVGSQLKEMFHVPLVLTSHGYDIYNLPFKNDFWKKNIKMIIDKADQNITVSKSNLKYYKKLDISSSIRIIPNGVRSDLFHIKDRGYCRKKLNLPLDYKIILSVGNLVKIKGHRYLCDAINSVIQHNKSVKCLIIGQGSEKRRLEKKIKNLHLDSYIKLEGIIPHNELIYWLNACDVFVMPSIKESFGVVQIEAMACGKPIVATRNGGSDELINREELGFLCEPKNPSQLAEKIVHSLKKKWNIEAIVKTSYQYEWSEVVKKIIEIYENL